MKTLILGLIAFSTLLVNAQEMKTPQETVTQLFVATDKQDWPVVENTFANQVVLDYSSMNGNPASTLSPKQITDAWKSVLPGFEHTHHQLGNFMTTVEGNKAEVFCYGTATHFLQDPDGAVWTVVGSYDFVLIRENEAWNITSMKFNFKYQQGNTNLPAKAIQRIKQETMTRSNKETVKAFFQALEDENVDALVGLFAQDARHINPYASGIFPEGASGQQGIRDYWTPVFPNFDGMRFPIEELLEMEGGAVFVKYRGLIELKNGAGTYENQYYSTFKFNASGEITEYVEIFNPIVAARGFGLLEQIK